MIKIYDRFESLINSKFKSILSIKIMVKSVWFFGSICLVVMVRQSWGFDFKLMFLIINKSTSTYNLLLYLIKYYNNRVYNQRLNKFTLAPMGMIAKISLNRIYQTQTFLPWLTVLRISEYEFLQPVMAEGQFGAKNLFSQNKQAKNRVHTK